MDYQNKIVLVTGAYRGIGRSIVQYFLVKKAHLIVTYYHHENEIKEYYKEFDNNISFYQLDLAREESIQNLFNDIKEKYGKVDILINNAALSIDSYYLDKTKIEFMKVLEVNVVGTFLMIKYFSKIMHQGYIFNLSSTDGLDTGSVYSIDYNASKAGINMLTKTISLDSDNIIISLCPNWVDTESTKEMNKEYLASELKRIKQEKLINSTTIPLMINKCIKEKIASGSIIRIDGDIDE